MIDVFISYSQRDGERAQEIVGALESRGLTTWWDTSLLPGQSFADEIVRRINEAKIVIVLWSANSIRSEWVLAEAHRALDAGKLIPIFLPGVSPDQIPLPFNTIHGIFWTGAESFQILERALHFEGPERTLRFEDPEIGKAEPVREDASYSPRRGANRVRVFIAHASSDKKRLSAPLTEIVNMGFKVWIDKPEELEVSPSVQKRIGTDRIHYGQDWQSRIGEAVKKADCVLAFWSKDAIRGRSQQFYYELYMGLVQQKLIQCRNR